MRAYVCTLSVLVASKPLYCCTPNITDRSLVFTRGYCLLDQGKVANGIDEEF